MSDFMSENKKMGLIGLAFVVFLVFTSSVFTVRENEQVLILQFGSPRQQIEAPGLHFKLSFLDRAIFFEKRILNVDPPAEEVLLADQKRLVVDAFARYKITDMLKFFQTLGNENAAQQRLHTIINSALRSSLGKVPMNDVLSAKRHELMKGIQKSVNEETQRFGIAVVDVRIVRADLPEQVTQATFNRMKSEREREAQEARSQGEQLSLEIRSKADKDRTVLLAEAQKDSQILRGKGDREAIEIYGKAFSQDPSFYAFYRSLEAYRNSLANSDTTLMLAPDSDFLKYFKDSLR